MKDNHKTLVRSVLNTLAGEYDARSEDGSINVAALLSMIGNVAKELHAEQLGDAETIGAEVDALIARFPTLGMTSAIPMVAMNLCKGNSSELPAMVKRVESFVSANYESRKGRMRNGNPTARMVRK